MISDPPRVSVVMATYNRGNIIGYSIDSVRASTVTDWELIVVGDACTDDTAAVVTAFADPRIRFVNLAKNCGEQSGPNNEGTRLARGRYVAYLNHDDLWLSDHLAKSLAVFEHDADAQLVFGLGLRSESDGSALQLIGATALDDRYHPALCLPASLWVMRRELMRRIGPFRAAAELRTFPTLDWIHRCWKSGAKLVASDHLAAVIIPSGTRPDSYRRRESEVYKTWAARLNATDCSPLTLMRRGLYWDDLKARSKPWPFFCEGAKITGRRLFDSMGFFPPFPRYWLRYWRKGSFIRHLRKVRGLPQHAEI